MIIDTGALTMFEAAGETWCSWDVREIYLDGERLYGVQLVDLDFGYLYLEVPDSPGLSHMERREGAIRVELEDEVVCPDCGPRQRRATLLGAVPVRVPALRAGKPTKNGTVYPERALRAAGANTFLVLTEEELLDLSIGREEYIPPRGGVDQERILCNCLFPSQDDPAGVGEAAR